LLSGKEENTSFDIKQWLCKQQVSECLYYLECCGCPANLIRHAGEGKRENTQKRNLVLFWWKKCFLKWEKQRFKVKIFEIFQGGRVIIGYVPHKKYL
jgi:hypothetical protein